MLKTEEWLLIRDLYSRGFGINEIARQTGFDKKTVRKYLRLKTLPEPQKHLEERASLIHTNLTLWKSLMRDLIPPFVSFVKSKKWVLLNSPSHKTGLFCYIKP